MTTPIQAQPADQESPVPMVRRWYERLRRNTRRLTRFGMVGVLGFATDAGGFNLLCTPGNAPLHDHPVMAKVISTAVGIVVAWLGHRYWTFREKRRDSITREFALFMAVNLIGLVIATGCLVFSRKVLGLDSVLADNISANVIGLGMATLFRLWAMHTHVFTQARGENPDR